MSTSKKIDSSKLTLGMKKEIAKENTTTENENNLVDVAVKKIHETLKDNIPEKENVKEEVRRVTLDIPLSLHKKIMIKTIEEDIFIKDYFIKLAELDILQGN